MEYDIGIVRRRRIIPANDSYFVAPVPASGPTSLLLFPQAFDNAAWTKTGTTISADSSTAPDSSNTADTVTEDGTTGFHLVRQDVTKAASSISYTLTLDAKVSAGPSRRLVLDMTDNTDGNGAFAVFDITGGAMGVAATAFGSGWSSGTASISSAASGFFLCTLAGVTSDAGTVVRCSLQLDNGTGTSALSNSYAGNGVSGLIYWNAILSTP